LVATESPAGALVPLKVIGVLPLAVTVQFELTPTLPRNELVEVKAGGMFVLGVELNQLRELLFPSLSVSIEIKL
jgi:hypothetical protein